MHSVWTALTRLRTAVLRTSGGIRPGPPATVHRRPPRLVEPALGDPRAFFSRADGRTRAERPPAETRVTIRRGFPVTCACQRLCARGPFLKRGMSEPRQLPHGDHVARWERELVQGAGMAGNGVRVWSQACVRGDTRRESREGPTG